MYLVLVGKKAVVCVVVSCVLPVALWGDVLSVLPAVNHWSFLHRLESRLLLPFIVTTHPEMYTGEHNAAVFYQHLNGMKSVRRAP